MSIDLAVVVWPLLMLMSALIPVLIGIREYRRLQ